MSCEVPRDEILKNVEARLPDLFLISGRLDEKLQCAIPFLVVFQQPVNFSCMAVEDFSIQSHVGGPIFVRLRPFNW